MKTVPVAQDCVCQWLLSVYITGFPGSVSFQDACEFDLCSQTVTQTLYPLDNFLVTVMSCGKNQRLKIRGNFVAFKMYLRTMPTVHDVYNMIDCCVYV